jgi:hypothetical protein
VEWPSAVIRAEWNLASLAQCSASVEDAQRCAADPDTRVALIGDML